MAGRGTAEQSQHNPYASPVLEGIATSLYTTAGIYDRFADPRHLARVLGYRVRPVGPDGPRIELPRNVLCYVDDPDDAVWGESMFRALALALADDVDDPPIAALIWHLAAPPLLVRFFGPATLDMQPFLPRFSLRSWTRWVLGSVPSCLDV